MKRLAALAALLVLALVFAACGDGTERTRSGGAGDARAAAAGGGEFIDAFESSTFSARFEYDGVADELFAGEGFVAIAKRGLTHFRFDVDFSSPEPDFEPEPGEPDSLRMQFSMIITPDVEAMCWDEFSLLFLFGGGREKTCVVPDEDSEEFSPDTILEDLEDLDRANYTETTIDGREARCYKATLDDADDDTPTPDNDLNDEFDDDFFDDDTDFDVDVDGPSANDELCLSREGWILRIVAPTDDGSSQVADAQDLSSDVPDSAFELPYPLFEPETLEVRNDSDVEIYVRAASGESDGIILSGGANVDIEPGETATIDAGLSGDPTHVKFGTYESPQWSWRCDWDDAKSNEPFVIGDDTSNCDDPERVEEPDYFNYDDDYDFDSGDLGGDDSDGDGSDRGRDDVIELPPLELDPLPTE
jgi:hypothetical protein